MWARADAGQSWVVNQVTDEDRARAAHFCRLDDQARCLVAGALARTAIGSCIGQPPQRVMIDRSGYGRKPEVVGGKANFSVSHCGSWVCVAVSTVAPVGVDIQVVSADYPWPLLCDQLAEAGNRPATRWQFLRTWTLKEAYAKSIGIGLAVPMAEVVLVPGHAWHPGYPVSATAAWTGPGDYAGAVALLGAVSVTVSHQTFDGQGKPVEGLPSPC